MFSIMDIEHLQTIANSFKAVTEDIKWQEHLVFSVGAKMFLLISPDEHPVTACFKVSEEDFDILIERNGFSQAPHFAKRKWIMIDDINKMENKDWKIYVSRSYNAVTNKLSKRLKQELGL